MEIRLTGAYVGRMIATGPRERSATTVPPDQLARKWLSPIYQVAHVTLEATPLRENGHTVRSGLHHHVGGGCRDG